MSKFLIIGCGNMASALIRGVYLQFKDIEFTCYTPSRTKAESLATEVNGNVLDSLDSDLSVYDFIMIGCKPQQFLDLSKELKGRLDEEATIVSILAGVGTDTIKDNLGISNIIRMMPNTPSLYGQGVNAIYPSSELDPSITNTVITWFGQSSTLIEFDDEEKINIITPFSGSGPAYFFEIARIMTDSLIDQGIDQTIAREMVVGTILGAGVMMRESSDDLITLRNNVTSKGGVTAEALNVFTEENLEEIFNKATKAAYLRNKELSK